MGQHSKTKECVVYFAGAIRGDRSVAHYMIELIDFIKTEDIQVLTEHIKSSKPTDTNRPAEEIEIRDIAWIDEATHVIAEISGASTGTGREIEYARNKELMGKNPTNILCLYHSDREFHASPMVRGMTPNRYPNVTVRAYQTIDEAKNIVRRFLRA